MAIIQPTFELTSNISLTLSGVDNWVDILSYGPNINSPIPAGKQIWFGYMICINWDKNANFELRPNLPGKSAGTVADTQLRGFVAVPTGESRDLDVYYNGAIVSLAPVTAQSTGVEKLWLRIRSSSASSSSYDFIAYYTLY